MASERSVILGDDPFVQSSHVKAKATEGKVKEAVKAATYGKKEKEALLDEVQLSAALEKQGEIHAGKVKAEVLSSSAPATVHLHPFDADDATYPPLRLRKASTNLRERTAWWTTTGASPLSRSLSPPKFTHTSILNSTAPSPRSINSSNLDTEIIPNLHLPAPVMPVDEQHRKGPDWPHSKVMPNPLASEPPTNERRKPTGWPYSTAMPNQLASQPPTDKRRKPTEWPYSHVVPEPLAVHPPDDDMIAFASNLTKKNKEIKEQQEAQAKQQVESIEGAAKSVEFGKDTMEDMKALTEDFSGETSSLPAMDKKGKKKASMFFNSPEKQGVAKEKVSMSFHSPEKEGGLKKKASMFLRNPQKEGGLKEKASMLLRSPEKKPTVKKSASMQFNSPGKEGAGKKLFGKFFS